MCHKTSRVPFRGMSPLPIKLAKISAVLIFFFFAECAAGSCLSYGHACWGAHGKRNGVHNSGIPSRDPNWFLSRLVQSPQNLHYLNGRDAEIPTSQRMGERQLFSDDDMETDPLKGQDDYRTLQEMLQDDDTILMDNVYPRQRAAIKSQKYIDNRPSKML